MVELIGWKKQPGDGINQYQIQAFADDKSDVGPEMVINNASPSWVLQPGSSIRTADGDIAFLKSNGKWHFIGEDGDIDV